MILLGAGASKEFGPPTLQDFTLNALEMLKSSGFSSEVETIKSVFHDYEMPLDFESIYNIIEALCDPDTAIKKAGPFTLFLLRKKPNLLPKNQGVEVLNKLRDMICNQCEIPHSKISHIIKAYDPLMNFLSTYNEAMIFNGNSRLFPINSHIITTNYDMAMEIYLLNKKNRIVDGYINNQYEENVKNFAWNILYNPWDLMSDKKSTLLLKLHGSIYQFETLEGKLIKTYINPETIPNLLDIDKKMMIYPTKEKEILSRQYYYFFNCFKSLEWRVLISIGYSFRDEPINTAIRDRLSLEKNSKLIIINPHPEKVLTNLGDIPNNQVVLIPHKFGITEKSKDIIKELEMHFDEDHWRDGIPIFPKVDNK